MFCIFCGKEVEDSANVCPWCGMTLNKEPVEKTTESTFTQPSNEQVINEAVCAYPMPKKKKKHTVLGIVIASLVVLGVAGYFARAHILAAIAPKYYTAWCMSNTIEQLEEESLKMQEELFGFKVDGTTPLTSRASIGVSDNARVSAMVSNSPKDKAIYAEVSTRANGDEIELNMLLNDEIVGVKVPNLSEDTYFAVSSKNFGDEIMNTKIAAVKEFLEENNIDISGMDLSYSAINPAMNEETLKAMRKELLEVGFEFIKSCEIKDTATKEIEIDGKDKTAKTVTIEFGGKELGKFAQDYCKAIAKNKDVKKLLGEGYTKTLLNMADEISQIDLPGEYEVEFALYKDRVVGLEFALKDNDVKLGYAFGSTKTMINDVTVTIASATEFAGNKIASEVSLNAKGNHIPKNNKFETLITISAMGQKAEIKFEADFKTEKVTLAAKAINQEAELTGTCSNDDGFNLKIAKAPFELEFDVSKGAQIKELTGKKYMILEHSETEIARKVLPQRERLTPGFDLEIETKESEEVYEEKIEDDEFPAAVPKDIPGSVTMPEISIEDMPSIPSDVKLKIS